MNYNKYKFTTTEFLQMLSVDDLSDVPVNTPFLYTERQKNQKDIVLKLMKELSLEELNNMLKDKKNPITVQFWIKYRGNKTQIDHFQDQGGKLIVEEENATG